LSRAPGLDLLRAFAILWVMFYHAAVLDLVPDSNPVAAFGWMGVDLFFALSGFLIGGQLFRPYARHAPEHFGLFYLRRLFRTLPPYLVVVALYFTVPVFRERKTIEPLWQFLTFTENLFIDFSHPRAFSHVWSLCVEEQFYLVAPMVVFGLMRRPSLWLAAVFCGGVLIGGMALRGYIWLHDLGPIQHITTGPGNFYQRWNERIYYPTWTRLDGLLDGMAFAAIRAFRPGLWAGLMQRANLILTLGVAAVAVAIGLFVHQQTFAPTVIGYPILSFGMACLVAAGASPRSLIGRWQVPGAAAVAAMAYSLYLTHKQVYHMVHLLVGQQLDQKPVLASLIYSSAALAAGGLLYVTLERPALRLRDRILKAAAKPTPETIAGAPISPGA
jgi:peptidoglycan/LPS O-acetylase OafA/YrhL